MSISAICALADIASVNTTLEGQGFGPGNFAVPAYTGAAATHAALHCWDNPNFLAALQAIPAIQVLVDAGEPFLQTQALIESVAAKWGAQAPPLPSSGIITAGALYRFEDLLWSVIQTFDRTTFNAHPSTYPALIRTVHEPGVIAPWKQPIDQYDAYKLVNPFNGLPDQCTHNGQTWTVSAADGAGNNVWEPGVFGWTYPGYVAPPSATWVDTGATVAQLVAAGIYRLNAIVTGLSVGQAIRLGELPAGETVFNGYWPTAATPSDYISITPHVTAAVGAKVWKWT
jgi:hypothetical protein